jgi:hypothetical protein
MTMPHNTVIPSISRHAVSLPTICSSRRVPLPRAGAACRRRVRAPMVLLVCRADHVKMKVWFARSVMD